MQIACPHCQVKGKVKDALIGKMVRCPKCEETFVVEAVVNNNTDTSTKMLQTPKIEHLDDLTTCSKCGFTFSEESITTKNRVQLCELCSFLNSQERASLASKVDSIFSKLYLT